MTKRNLKYLTILSVLLACLVIHCAVTRANGSVRVKGLILYRNKMVLVANGENDKPIATFSVSCNLIKTPLGDRTISEKKRWHTLYGTNNYGQYCLRFGDLSKGEHLLLHSVLFAQKYNPYSLKVTTYNGIKDKIQSKGCVRLRTGEAKWLYDNVEVGTIIHIIDTEEDIVRPDFEYLSESSLFDPTDIETINMR